MDDGRESEPRCAAHHQLDAAHVRVLDDARGGAAKLDRCRGMDHTVAAAECLLNRARVGHIANHDVVGDDAQRLEHCANLRGIAHQQAHVVSGAGERTHGVRAGESGAAGDQNLHTWSIAPNRGVGGVRAGSRRECDERRLGGRPTTALTTACMSAERRPCQWWRTEEGRFRTRSSRRWHHRSRPRTERRGCKSRGRL